MTETEADSPLALGERIVRIQRMTPEQIRHYMRFNAFYSTVPERELWGGYLRMAASVEVERTDGTRELIKLPALPERPVDYPIKFEQLDKCTAYLRLERLDRDAIAALLNENEAAIAGSEKLILDLRRCVGGDEDAAWPLLPYLVDEPVSLAALLDERGSYVNFTKLNCELRYKTLSDYAASVSDPEQRALLETERRFYLDRYGKGLCYKAPLKGDGQTVSPAAQAPRTVVLLTDTFCENEGESFSALCRRCGSKVVTLGRPTMGTLDYFDPITVALNEHMSLSYPIAMSVDAYEGRGIAEKGLPVDRYVPWTPEEIRRDVLLNEALAL